MLSEKCWSMVESYFGPHSVDLMSLNSKVMRSTDGKALEHLYTMSYDFIIRCKFVLSESKGEGKLYVYPPFAMIFPVLKFLEEQGVDCTVVVPKMNPLPKWWQKLKIILLVHFVQVERRKGSG